jgi:hypothetical protein
VTERPGRRLRSKPKPAEAEPKAVPTPIHWPGPADENWVSYACSHPTEQQSAGVQRSRRHPYPGERPEASGWCVVPSRCTCRCHRGS